MEYITVSMETLDSDFMMLLVTMLAVGSFSAILSSNNIIAGRMRSADSRDVMEIIGSLILYALVAINTVGFIDSEPSLFKTLSMIIGSIYIVVTPLAILNVIFRRFVKKT